MPARLTIAVYHHLHSGGAKRTTDDITRRLAAHHVVDLYTPAAPNSAHETPEGVRRVYALPFTPARRLGAPLGRINNALRLRALQRLDRVQRETARAIDARRYDLVYVHPCQVMQSPSLLTYLSTPSTYHCREPLREIYEPDVPRPYTARTPFKRTLDRVDPIAAVLKRARTALDRTALHAATQILTSSRFTQSAISRIYGAESAVCYHGVDTERFRPAAVTRDGGVLTVGALTPRKGIDLIVRGLALLPDAMRPPLTVVSNYEEPRERAFLEELAARGRVRLTCLKAVSDAVLIEHYQRARIVAYTPIREPFGLVPLEAMACGAAVIGIAEGGVCETVEPNRTGLLVERDARQFADAAQRLILDPALATDLGMAGRRAVLARWTWDRSMKELEERLAACAASGIQN